MISAVTSRAGVTSNAGLAAGLAVGAVAHDVHLALEAGVEVLVGIAPGVGGQAVLTRTLAALAADDAIARIGPVPALELRALALEEQSGRVDAALNRLDRLTLAAERRETWLRRRGDLLRRAGREDAARAAYSAALHAIASLPTWLRESPELENLAKELATLSVPHPSSSP